MRADPAVLVFAKAPVPGVAKTRLMPALGPDGAARLHARLVEWTLSEVAASGLAVELWCTPDAQHRFFAQCAARYKVRLERQPEGDLGERLQYAAMRAIDRGQMPILIGTDCPELTAERLRGAAMDLRIGYDAVAIPAEDGGYVALGLRRYDAELFHGITWGTGTVMAETRARLAARHWHWREWPALWDVDRPEDLLRLRASFPALLNDCNKEQG